MEHKLFLCIMFLKKIALRVEQSGTQAVSLEGNRLVSMSYERNGATGTIRTYDLLIRSQVLYPAKLRLRR